MANDVIMQFGVYIFFILFMFLMMVFFSAILAIFKNPKYPFYEPNVSVVIPCYNEEKNIKKCLDHVYALKYPAAKLEIIVVDDGSTDRTAQIVKTYMKLKKNLRIVKGNHQGKSLSMNKGVDLSKNEIIMTVDADTFIDRRSLERLVRPMQNKIVGATNGSCVALNSGSVLAIFQKIEYHYNNLIRRSFSVLFNNGIWFFGAFACYKKSVLTKVGGFKKDTMTEDMDTAMEIYMVGFRTINVHDAFGYTTVPETIKAFYRQRMRWWMGALQTLNKNFSLLSTKSNPSILFLFVSQYWWSFYAFISIPLIAYQVFYWLPTNLGSGFDTFMYLFRWFSLAGPFYVIYKIPEWGINIYNIFGVVSGIISLFLIIWSIYMFNDKLSLKNIFGIFFYFPYTIILNSIIIIGMIRLLFTKKSYFIG